MLVFVGADFENFRHTTALTTHHAHHSSSRERENSTNDVARAAVRENSKILASLQFNDSPAWESVSIKYDPRHW
eukprot:3517440-Rhodomonas_salina.4